jgi:putative oxidoreductase
VSVNQRTYDLVLALLRVVTGFIVWQHGAQPLLGMPGGTPAAPGSPDWFVGLVEFAGGIALALGVWTRPVALAIAIDMAVRYLTQYLPEAFPPIYVRAAEVVCQIASVTTLLVFTGPGRWSLEESTLRIAGSLAPVVERMRRAQPAALGAVRIVMGLMFWCYGLRKMLGWLGEEPEPYLSLQWFAGIVELVGGVLLVAGLFTRPTAFVCSGQMAFAYFINHNPRGFFPILNGGERATLFCFFFLFLVVAGAGRWSLDWRRAGARPLWAGPA